MNRTEFPASHRPGALGLALALSLLLAAAICLAPAPASARSDPNGFSLGLVLGDPTGLTLRGGIGERMAIQAHVGFSPFPGDGIVVMADWTYDAWDFLKDNPTAGLMFFFGFGAKGEWFLGRYFIYERDGRHSLPDRSHFGFGLRGLVGLRVPFRKAPFDLFFELAPLGLVLVVPDTSVHYDFDAAIGFRYRF